MICKFCGAELSESAGKCKRCGNEIPAMSDCGGFYDLTSKGTKLWQAENGFAPAPSMTAAPAAPAAPVKKSKAAAIVAAVLAIGLAASLLSQCSGNKKRDDRIKALEDKLAAAQTVPDETPTDPSTPEKPDFTLPAQSSVHLSVVLNTSGSATITSTIRTPGDDGITALSTIIAPVKEYSLDMGSILPICLDWKADGSALTVNVEADPQLFGEATAETYLWEYRIGNADYTALDTEKFTAQNNVLTCSAAENCTFKLTYTRTTETGGTQTITVEGLALH